MKHIYSFLVIVIFSFLFYASANQPASSTENQRIPAQFDFSPSSRQQVGAAKMTVALVKASFVGSNPEFYIPPFNEMANSMANDFEELLTAKGFTVRGPFGSRDEMLYGDKTSSNFALDVSIDLNPQYNRKSRYISSQMGGLVPASYKMSGDITLSGSLVLTAASPKNGEKLWKKNIALTPAVFNYVGSTRWANVPTMAGELKHDNTLYNILARELEKFYEQAMDLAWQQIDINEMKEVAKEATKADKRN